VPFEGMYQLLELCARLVGFLGLILHFCTYKYRVSSCWYTQQTLPHAGGFVYMW